MTDVDMLFAESACSTQNNVLNEVLFTALNGFFMIRNHFMSHMFFELVDRTITAGIPQHLYEYHKWVMLKRQIQGSARRLIDGPQVLTVPDLSFGFVLWLIACGISAIAFMFEMIMWPFFKRKQKKFYRKLQKIHPLIVDVPEVRIFNPDDEVVDDENLKIIYEKFRIKSENIKNINSKNE